MMRSPVPALFVLVCWGCGPTSVSIPEVPQLQAAIDLFDHPTGTVPIADVSNQVAEAGQRLDALESSRLADLLSQGLTALRQRLQENGLNTDPQAPPPRNEPQVDGYLRVDRTCRGWNDASSTPDAADGTLQILAVVRDRELQRALSTTAHACKGRVDVPGQATAHPFVDGQLDIGLEGPLPRTVDETRMVVQADATIGNDTKTARLAFTFRVIYPRLEVAVPVGDGQIVVARNADGFEMRGSNGTFTCSIETATCQ